MVDIQEIQPGSQSEFQETPYEDQSWEIIDEVDENPQFHVLDIEILEGSTFTADPMFEDYGGKLETGDEKRFSLPGEDGESAQENVVDKLKQEIATLKAEQDAKIEEEKKAAFEAGKAEGKAEGIEEAKAQESEASQMIRKVVEDISLQLSAAVEEIQKQAVEFSLDVARKLIDTSVEINPEYLIPIVKEALSNAGAAMIQKIRVSPADFEFIEVVGVRKIIEEHDGSWDFEPDTTVHSGCIVETSAGEIDYQLDDAWKRIAEDVVKIIR